MSVYECRACPNHCTMVFVDDDVAKQMLPKTCDTIKRRKDTKCDWKKV